VSAYITYISYSKDGCGGGLTRNTHFTVPLRTDLYSLLPNPWNTRREMIRCVVGYPCLTRAILLGM
jgi:hypothetical protein